jgi:hypothetical protein
MNLRKVFAQFALLFCTFISIEVGAAPLSFKVSNSRGEAWNYYRAPNGQWVFEQRAAGSPFVRKPLAKLQHQRIFEDLRRSVVQRPRTAEGGACSGLRAEVELGAFSKPQSRKLCLGRLVDKDFYGRILGRLDEAQGKKGSGRRLFSR